MLTAPITIAGRNSPKANQNSELVLPLLEDSERYAWAGEDVGATTFSFEILGSDFSSFVAGAVSGVVVSGLMDFGSAGAAGFAGTTGAAGGVEARGGISVLSIT